MGLAKAIGQNLANCLLSIVNSAGGHGDTAPTAGKPSTANCQLSTASRSLYLSTNVNFYVKNC
ncbi:MAG: hypothetical protein HC849_26125 [Oscillatoriales cyanobacterium RU_3_3]|nr:hypothetical protein [Microcoleus sp. SU_5_3]NJL68552.1 hypothetical protein [Microcoleus sp. SM1_3_4]NJM62879.1 hypothetical protein [Oscillatoriales cyanobacterium RU_3_3]NJR26317.1 hypothetical protein [Richelia sp. CSU_2_1]